MQTYGTPKRGDRVAHMDFPDEAGVVISVTEFAFEVRWPDGETDDYNVQDHPDLIAWED